MQALTMRGVQKHAATRDADLFMAGRITSVAIGCDRISEVTSPLVFPIHRHNFPCSPLSAEYGDVGLHPLCASLHGNARLTHRNSCRKNILNDSLGEIMQKMRLPILTVGIKGRLRSMPQIEEERRLKEGI